MSESKKGAELGYSAVNSSVYMHTRSVADCIDGARRHAHAHLYT